MSLLVQTRIRNTDIFFSFSNFGYTYTYIYIYSIYIYINIVSIYLLLAGVGFASLNEIGFNIFGLVIACCSAICNTLFNIFAKRAIQNRDKRLDYASIQVCNYSIAARYTVMYIF